MPIVSIRIPTNVFDQEARDHLARRVTDACARAESIPDTPANRIGIWVVIDEVEEDHWYVGGGREALAAFVPVMVSVHAPEGVLDEERRRELVIGTTAAIDASLPAGQPGAQTSVAMLDVPEGRWGVRDQIVGLKQHAALWGYEHLQHLVTETRTPGEAG